METETKPAPKLAAIRTYAKDLDTKRNDKTVTPTSQSVPAVNEAPIVEKPVRASDTLTTEVTKAPAPTPIPKPEPKKLDTVPALKPITPTKKDPTIIVDNEDAAAATIITDTKRGEFKLIPAIINSIRGWFTEKQQDYRAKKIPKYTVPDTTRRKGIIQKATSKSGKFAAADFSSIQERILERKAAAAKAKEGPDEPETIWTANTEPGFPLLTEATVPQQVSNVQVVSRKSFRAIPEEIVVTTSAPVVAPEPEFVPEIAEPDDNRWSAPIQESTPAPTLPAVAVMDEPTPTTAPAPEETVTEEEPVVPEPELVAEPTQPEIKKGRFSLLKVNTNTLTIFVSGVVVILAVLSATVYFVFYKDSAFVSNTPMPETLLTDTEVRPLVLYTISADSIIEAFTSMQNERGTTQGVFMYTSTIGSTETVAPTELLSALELVVAPDFAQTISAVRVGYINQAPYLVLKIKNETAAQGGLLMWEDTMYTDLMPVLSLAPETTDTFLDATISGTDVRVLKNTNGSERLLYGLASDTIVITTNSARYAQLTTLLK